MKKSLLSVLAAGLVVTAVAPVALAADDAAYGLGATRWSAESPVWVDDVNTPATAAQIKDYNDKDLGTKSEKWTRDANKLKKGETLKVDKGQADKKAPMAGAKKPAGKVLPKTSAAK